MNTSHIGARVSPELHAAFLALGGNLWLRRQIAAAMAAPPEPSTTEQRYRVLADRYQAGDKVDAICADYRCDRKTVMRAVDWAGVQRRRARRPRA